MGEHLTIDTRLRKLLRGLPRPQLRSRTMLVLVPVHLLAFVALYLGLVRVVRSEILQTHSRDARLLLNEAVRDLHPYMCQEDQSQIPAQVGAFAHSHALLDLHVYRPDGTLLSGTGGVDTEVQAFLRGHEDEHFYFLTDGAAASLRGISRIRAKDSCVECHAQGEQLGAATMLLDLSSEVDIAQSHLKRSLAILVASWTLLVGFLNFGFAAWTRRSLARMHTQLEATPGAEASTSLPPGLLDPVGAEIYDSLSRLIRERRERKDAVDDRLHHTDRLASLGQLAAGLAHEIKNPLAGIRGVMELLRDETDDDAKKDLYEQIVNELDRVNGTIHSLLHFARPGQPRREQVDIAELLEGSVHLLRASLAQRAIEITVEVARDAGSVPLDAAQIRQVLTNLVTNAADAIEQNGSIVVRATRFPEGSGLIISVSDDGPGIPEEVQGQLFEPFFTTKFSGTGLGLAVVRSLVHQHGGRIEVRSEVGHGSTFFVLLPDLTPRDDAVPPAEPAPREE